MLSGIYKKFWLLTLSLSLCFYISCAVNPLTGEEELMLFPEEQDIEIGQKYAPEIEKQMGGRIDNPQLQSYVDYIGQQIARVSHKPYLDYHFVALEHKSMNAFALPGGYIFITKGMLKELKSEAQLAGILGHEISHVVARDSAAAMSREIGISILLSAAASQDAPRGVLTAADVTRQIIGLQYSREDEQVADLAGLDYMVWAGYNPYAMVETVQMLQDKQTDRPVEFFSTHPSPGNRIAYLTQVIQTKYYNLTGLKIGKEDYHTAVLTRLNK